MWPEDLQREQGSDTGALLWCQVSSGQLRSAWGRVVGAEAKAGRGLQGRLWEHRGQVGARVPGRRPLNPQRGGSGTDPSGCILKGHFPSGTMRCTVCGLCPDCTWRSPGRAAQGTGVRYFFLHLTHQTWMRKSCDSV